VGCNVVILFIALLLQWSNSSSETRHWYSAICTVGVRQLVSTKQTTMTNNYNEHTN